MAPARKKQRLSEGGVAVSESDEPPTDTTQPQEKTAQQNRSLFVRSLPQSTTSESLTDLFSESFPVKHAIAVIDTETKQCRGYGFVTFADAEDAQQAKEEFNGRVVDGRKLRIELAEPRHRDGEGAAPENERPQTREPQPSKLIVRNLPWSIKRSDQLAKLFMGYGKIKQAYIPKKGPGLMSGFGFVMMRGRKNAEKAMEAVNGKEVDGRTLAVDWAVEKGAYEGTVKGGSEQAATGAGHPDHDSADGYGSDEDDMQEFDEERMEGFDEDAELDEEDLEVENAPQTNNGGHKSEDRSCTLFIRNLPFTCTDEDLEDHFSQFGSIRYARIVLDRGTERSKGTGFVCFYNKDDAATCIRGAPRRLNPADYRQSNNEGKTTSVGQSILQNEEADSTGQYTLDGRILQISQALDKSDATRLTEEGVEHRNRRDKDKRRLYLLSEGTISPKSKLWEKLSPSEKAMREASAKQRKTLIEGNPSLNLSFTRLSIRNIPRTIGSKELKALAREAVVGFATNTKARSREKLSKEELARGGEEMKTLELERKRAGKGIVRQAKVVFEGAGGSKVSEDTGAGRSRGYGFIEYYTHRNALMGLRWLNGHAVGSRPGDRSADANQEDAQDRKKRLIVEFAIENAQVVLRRNDREDKARTRSADIKQGFHTAPEPTESSTATSKRQKSDPGKRKRGSDAMRPGQASNELNPATIPGKTKKPVDEKLARRNQIIGRKRALRRARKGGKS